MWADPGTFDAKKVHSVGECRGTCPGCRRGSVALLCVRRTAYVRSDLLVRMCTMAVHVFGWVPKRPFGIAYVRTAHNVYAACEVSAPMKIPCAMRGPRML